MLLLDSLAEEKISSAIRRGELDDLPGRGRPLPAEDLGGVPEGLRVAYRLLKNAGCLPPELALRNQIGEVETLLSRVESADEVSRLRRRLCLLKARLAMRGREFDLLAREGEYREKLLRRLACADKEAQARAESPA